MRPSSHIEKQLIDNNPDAIILTDENFLIEYINKTASILYGYTIEELRGKSTRIFEVPEKGMSPEDWTSLEQTGRWAGKAHRRTKDGSTFHASLSIFTLYDDSGKAIGYAANVKDITQTIAITDALIEKQHQLKSIFDNTTDIIASIDKDLNVVEFNQVLARRIKGSFNIELKRGDYMLNYITPTKHDIFKSLYARVFKGERLTDVEVFKTIDGDHLYFETSYNPIIDE